MPQGLNKKVLCFVDEYGTAGVGDLYLGAVFVMAREAGRLDKCLSDLLEPNANEIHAANLADGYLQGLMQRFWLAAPPGRLIMINRKIGMQGGQPPVVYAQALIETIKIGLKRFRADVLDRATIGNVEVITDANHHNGHPAFAAEIIKAQSSDGVFRAVNHVVRNRCEPPTWRRVGQMGESVQAEYAQVDRWTVQVVISPIKIEMTAAEEAGAS